ncbi:hypothetical protein PV08_01954 [Exophiala spinifera]|uniref:NACHT domain-containing protein n=1 Tax=Exophiala spinifera TaxID=91928 RepID=A0A0D2CCZ3_9EURO|nr:uncharacterized protein PV08_01954 [Exophiala spinifera]KIW21374.1 hypothetical protein PV08_01954 [Exophiala spinifera]
MATSQSPGSILNDAFRKLKDSVTSADAISFQKTELEDVWKTAEEIQKTQRARQSVQALRRIQPLLENLEKYSKVVEVLCNGTPFLPWIWAPIKLMVQLASGHTKIFDQLLDAYAEIAAAMPHFDRLQAGFSDDDNFKVILALVYADILEFHQRAYKLFRRRSWHILFDSLWKSFDSRFSGILANLSKHKEMLMKEAIAIDIVEARKWRTRAAEELDKQEKGRNQIYISDTLAWLNIQQEDQEDELDRLLAKRQPGTCDWVFRHPKFVTWKTEAHAERVLWMNGIPGAGKTILTSYIIDKLQNDSKTITIAYIICNSYTSGKNILSETMRGLAAQLLRANPDIMPYAFDNYANKALPPSVSHVRKLLSEILGMIPETFLFIDGLDEYTESQQRSILTEVLPLTRVTGGTCKVLLSSRDVPSISKRMKSKPRISLRDEYSGVEEDIQKYLAEELQEIKERFEGKENEMEEIIEVIALKADGMFLWVRLILDELRKCYSMDELRKTVEGLPKGIDEAYGRVLERITKEMDVDEYAKARRILEWLACSCRLMKIHEVQDGIAFHADNLVLNDDTKFSPAVLDLCRPLIEEGPNNTIDFVHYSAKEYILDKASGPLLWESQAHYDLAFACITYLNTSFCFYQYASSHHIVRTKVAKGFHGLHNYATEYWFQHLLLCSRELERLDERHLITEALKTLQAQFWKAQPGTAAKNLKLDDTTTANEISEELSSFGDYESFRQVGVDIATFRAHLIQEKHAHEVAEKHHAYEIEHDPTHFSAITKRYQEVVLFLLTCSPEDVSDDIDLEILNTFRKVYGESEFTCRFHECPYHSDGFQSIQDRNQHEQTHMKTLRCADPSCEFFARGFTSKTGLQKHNRKYHPTPDEVELPKFVPVRPVTPPPVFIPPPPPRSPTPPLFRMPIPPASAPLRPVVQPQSERCERIKKVRLKRGKRGLRVHACESCTKVF